MEKNFNILIKVLREMKGFTKSPYIDYRENFESILDEKLTDNLSFDKDKLKTSINLIWKNVKSNLEILEKINDVWFKISSELILLGFPDPINLSKLTKIYNKLKFQEESVSNGLADNLDQVIKELSIVNLSIKEKINIQNYRYALIEIWRILYIDYYKIDKMKFNYIITKLTELGLPCGIF